MFKAQTEVVTMVLITGIVISLVGTAYLWGAPLINKRTSIIEVDTGKEFVERLDKTIVDIANSGTGERILDIPNGILTVYGNNTDDPNNNSIVYDITTDQQMMFPGTVVFLSDTRDLVGVYGEVDPQIVTMTGVESNFIHGIQIKSHYRELDTEQANPQKGFRIIINEDAGVLLGDSKVTVSFNKVETLPSRASNGGDLIVTHVNVIPF